WAEERALTADATGLYVLICITPRHVEVYARENAEQAFDKRTREKLRKSLARDLGKNSSLALENTLASVQEHLDEGKSRAHRGGWLWIVWVILGILGIWVLIRLAGHSRSGKMPAPPSAVSGAALAGQSI